MIGDAEHQSRVLGACSSDSSGGHVGCPDFVIINTGLHVRWRSGSIGAAEMRNYLRGVFALPVPLLSRAVWRETIVQHFPSDDGLYEHRNQSDEASRMAPTCKLRINISDHSALYRQHYAHSPMVEIAREQGVHPLPYVSIDGVEANSGHLFPLPPVSTFEVTTLIWTALIVFTRPCTTMLSLLHLQTLCVGTSDLLYRQRPIKIQSYKLKKGCCANIVRVGD